MLALPMSAAFPRPKAVPARDPSPLDGTTIERCRAQDAVAFRTFVVRYERTVFALLSRILGRRPDIEDLAQETFVRAYRAFPTFDVERSAKVSTWLLTIATRLALDARKRSRPEEEVDAEIATTAATPERALEQRELGHALVRAAATLPEDQRAALVLAELHGLSMAEIADALGVPEATAKTRLFRARTQMRAALADEWRTP
jgi:RNA polymerase sigma-70 factor (ECF subfamily)